MWISYMGGKLLRTSISDREAGEALETIIQKSRCQVRNLDEAREKLEA